jgi:hypothetical protein
MKKVFISFAFLIAFMSGKSQNLMHVAFDTNGPMGECLFPQDELGNIVFTGIVETDFSADTIMGLAKEFLYSISKKYKAKTSNELEGITKIACDIELNVAKGYLSVGNIGRWEKSASTIKFCMMLDIRNKKYRYTLNNFTTDRYRIPGEGKDQGPSNMIHWQRVNSLTKEMNKARKKEQEHFQELIDYENSLYQAEYNAVQDVIRGLKTLTIIEDDF